MIAIRCESIVGGAVRWATDMSVDFNALVLAMRAERTTASMMVVYEQLFRLEEWFLPNDPVQPLGTPMQWQFPDGLNQTPCILIYTDADPARRRADEIAASLGATSAVLSLSVVDAVRWILSGDLSVSWASINHGAGLENFPLYFFQVEELARAFGVLHQP